MQWLKIRRKKLIISVKNLSMHQLFKQFYTDRKVSEKSLNNLNKELESAGLNQLLTWGHLAFSSDMVLGTGFGPSGIVLIDRLSELNIPIPVFYLDTHLLFDETYELKKRIEQRFDLSITRVSSDLSLGEQAEKYGDKLWEKNPDFCCYYRKVLPLRNYLSDKKVWITGIRRSQSATRRNTQIMEWDSSNEVIKLNPLARWTDDEVWGYINRKELPHNPLHDDGYPSIGCIPCTQPVSEDANGERAGRWNGLEKTECGIHRPAQKSY